jgi:primosomal protein N' (replication factor Y)
MYTVQVIPIARATPVDDLTYFSATEYQVGDIVFVTMRNKEVPAVVQEVVRVEHAKAVLKSSSYALRKIRAQKPHGHLLPEFIAAAQDTATYHATSVGAVLHAHVPYELLAGVEHTGTEHRAGQRPSLRGFIIPRLYQGPFEARMEFYRTAVREAFAARGSVYIVVPTAAEAERVYARLSPGIEQYSFFLSSEVRKSLQAERMQSIVSTEHAVLVVATSAYLGIPRHDLSTVIIEHENSSLYRQRTRPFIDVRILAHHVAARRGGQLFLADLPLRIESVYRRELGEYEEVASGHQRTQFPVPAEIVSLKGERREPKHAFRSIGATLLDALERTVVQGGERAVLYVARRGLSPVTLCGDCGTTVTCRECGASVVLHKGSEENYFLCHACGSLRHARERCTNCESWRLEAFGVGVELVAAELTERLPGARVMLLSSDTVKTPAAARKCIAEFYETRGCILVITERALAHLHSPVPLMAVVSLDSLLSLASWNMYEKIAATLTRLRELASARFLLQTRHPDTSVLTQVVGGNFSGYYRSELAMRKRLGYPPYTVIIKVSTIGTQDEVVRRIDSAVELMRPYELIPFSRMIRAPGNKFAYHAFLRLARESWPDRELVARLRALPPYFAVHVDPDSIL